MKWFWALLILFTLTRFYHLMVIPPFMDELIYVRWLNGIKATGDWLIPLKEFGWEPLGIWLAHLINLIVPNPLFSLRLLSVFGSGIIIWLLARFISLPAAVIYALSPLTLINDRLGLRGDNLVVLAGLIVYLGLRQRLVNKRVQGAIGIGLGIALGLFTKTTAAALPVIVLLGYFWFRPKIKWPDFLGAGLAAVPIIFYWLSGTWVQVIGKEGVFLGGFLLKNNLLQIGLWSWQVLTWPIILLALFGLAVKRKEILLQLNWLVPLLLLVVSAKILFPRYLLPIALFWLIGAGYGWQWLKANLPKALKPLLIVFLLAPVWLDFRILKDFTGAPLPEIERWQYITGWPSGYGVKEMVDYLRFNPPAELVVEDNDLFKSGLNYYWPGNSLSVTIEPVSGAEMITNVSDRPPEQFQAELIKEISRPENKSKIRLWRLE